MRSYVNSKDLKYDSSDLILILEGLLDLELSDGDLYNCFYAILTRYRPRTREQLVTILDLLVQFFDPMLFRQLQGHFQGHHRSSSLNFVYSSTIGHYPACERMGIVLLSQLSD